MCACFLQPNKKPTKSRENVHKTAAAATAAQEPVPSDYVIRKRVRGRVLLSLLSFAMSALDLPLTLGVDEGKERERKRARASDSS